MKGVLKMKRHYIHPEMEVVNLEVCQMLAASGTGLPTEMEDILQWEDPAGSFLEDEIIA